MNDHTWMLELQQRRPALTGGEKKTSGKSKILDRARPSDTLIVRLLVFVLSIAVLLLNRYLR